MFLEWDADRVIAEVNQGGDLVESNLRVENPNMPVKKIHSFRGKERRAEPVAALYEKGKFLHVGEFTALEDQMCAITPGFDDKSQGWSPDRVDALVFAAMDLFPSLTANRSRRGEAVSAPQFNMV